MVAYSPSDIQTCVKILKFTLNFKIRISHITGILHVAKHLMMTKSVETYNEPLMWKII
jgi:hypothetical protein